ncbi:MAG: DUF3592 domain-containing protein [Spirochaetes bacterium]|nr:DUF3592 domain-containing protein [Spirochaetota bacterium]MBN2769382.1 DUF3592 domain-containing protein [Spirochaetota bacterium]
MIHFDKVFRTRDKFALQLLLVISVSFIAFIIGEFVYFSMAIIVLVILFWVLRIRLYLTARFSNGWMKTAGIVKSIAVVKNRGYMYGSIESLEVTYEYDVDGKKYLSDRYSIFPSDSFRSIDLKNRYRVGQLISIIYYSKDHSKAAEIKMTRERLFSPVWITMTILLSVFPLIFLFCG